MDQIGMHGFEYGESVAAVPEPASMTLIGIGIACIAGYSCDAAKQSRI